jgi:hypothetical protein
LRSCCLARNLRMEEAACERSLPLRRMLSRASHGCCRVGGGWAGRRGR